MTGRRRHKLFTLSLTALLLSLLQGCYLLGQSGPFLSDRFRAVANRTLLEDDTTDDQTREFLLEVERIGQFAASELSLAESKNYSKYVELDREHLAYIVYGADPLSFDMKRWRFPIVGEVPYKGFYSLEAARREASRLASKGLDTFISVVDGFSSLGFFTDPLYSFMKEYPPHRLAELIIHEQTHATVWIKGQTDFNEQLASFIGERGAREYIEKTFGKDSSQYTDIFALKRDRELYLQLVRDLKDELLGIYSDEALTNDEKLKDKEHRIEEFKQQITSELEGRFETDTYAAVPQMSINNAYLGLFGVYYASGPSLVDRLYEDSGRDLKRMIERLKVYHNKRVSLDELL